MKRTAALILAAAMLFAWIVHINAFTIIYDGKVEEYPWDPIVMVVDGQTVETSEMPPIILNGRTLVPAREFFEQLGAEVTWDQNTKRVSVDYNGVTIILTINSRTVYIGDNSAVISQADPAPKIINDKTMIPVRFVAEEFGFLVEWINETRTVMVTSPERESVHLTKMAFSQEEDNDCLFIGMDEFVNPNIFRMPDPDRIVVDIYGTVADFEDGTITPEATTVKTIRYSQHDDCFRVVMDLNARVDYEILKLKNGIEISLFKTGELIPEEESTENVIEEETPAPDSGNGFSVVLDPGHGGSDPGAIYPLNTYNPSLLEKDIALDIALKIRENLVNAGIGVVMTREDDSFPSLKERVSIANSSGADLFVSVHINSYSNPDVGGTQVYYYKKSAFGKKFAEIVNNKLLSYTPLIDREIQDGSTLYVVKNTNIPSILTETGFMTNAGDREYIGSEKGRQAIANAITDGILEALKLL